MYYTKYVNNRGNCGVYGSSVLCSQFFCKSKTFKNESLLKRKKGQEESWSIC